jgi:hypothetical protein
MSIFSKKPSSTSSSTRLSEFIREAPSREKKRVYAEVLKQASKKQKQVESASE